MVTKPTEEDSGELNRGPAVQSQVADPATAGDQIAQGSVDAEEEAEGEPPSGPSR